MSTSPYTMNDSFRDQLSNIVPEAGINNKRHVFLMANIGEGAITITKNKKKSWYRL